MQEKILKTIRVREYSDADGTVRTEVRFDQPVAMTLARLFGYVPQDEYTVIARKPWHEMKQEIESKAERLRNYTVVYDKTKWVLELHYESETIRQDIENYERAMEIVQNSLQRKFKIL